MSRGGTASEISFQREETIALMETMSPPGNGIPSGVAHVGNKKIPTKVLLWNFWDTATVNLSIPSLDFLDFLGQSFF